jgi:hypothetical protein
VPVSRYGVRPFSTSYISCHEYCLLAEWYLFLITWLLSNLLRCYYLPIIITTAYYYYFCVHYYIILLQSQSLIIIICSHRSPADPKPSVLRRRHQEHDSRREQIARLVTRLSSYIIQELSFQFQPLHHSCWSKQ